MGTSREITVIQAAAILISTIIGVGVLPLPLFAVHAANTGAPLVTLLAIMLAMFGLWVITKLGMRFPKKCMVQYSEDIIGKPMAWIGSLLFIAFFAVLTSLAAREFGEVVITSVLKRTPLEVTVMVMLFLAAISTRKDVTTFAYIHHFYLPILVGPGVLIVALSLKNAEVINLQPVWGNAPKGMLTGIITIAALFQGSFIHTMIIPHMRRPDKAMKASYWGMAVAGGLYLAIVIAALGVFGSEETEKLLWPTLELAKTTTLPANILERLDAAFLAIWVTAVFTTLFASYYLTNQSLATLFRLRDHKLFSLFLIPIVFLMAMIPKNILEMYRIIRMVGSLGLLITIGYPLLLLLIALIRKKRGEPVDGPPVEQTR